MNISESDPIHKATIIPRGNSLGMVVRLPIDDQVSVSYQSIIADIMVSTGGRIAEEMIFGADFITTGASADIKSATELAHKMVKDWGMSSRVGFRNCEVGFYDQKEFSEFTSQMIDEEVHSIITECYERAQYTLFEHKQQLHALANAMLERETLDGAEIRMVFEGTPLPPHIKYVPEKKSKKKSDDEEGEGDAVDDSGKDDGKRKSSRETSKKGKRGHKQEEPADV
jgi:cell division protease FtsH